MASAWRCAPRNSLSATGVSETRERNPPSSASADGRSWGPLVVMGVTSGAVPFPLLAWGEQRIGWSVAAVVNATPPMFTALFAALAVGERLRRPHLVGLVVGFLGVTVAAGLAGR